MFGELLPVDLDLLCLLPLAFCPIQSSKSTHELIYTRQKSCDKTHLTPANSLKKNHELKSPGAFNMKSREVGEFRLYLSNNANTCYEETDQQGSL